MSFTEVTMYRVICDVCGSSAQDNEFYAWADKDQAETEADSCDWLISGNGTHYCPNCVVYDEEHDEYVPKSKGQAETGDAS